jgi:Cft2 family RNA processing exonuclease
MIDFGATAGASERKYRMSARLIAVSGLGPKEPAAFVVETDGRRLLLDCGEGPEPGRLPDFDAIGQVDAVILSHGHSDHAAGLRFIDRIGRPPVFATAPVLTRIAKDLASHPIPIRGSAEVLGIALTTGTNGHAPGGVWLRLAVGEGLLYMGDHSTESTLYAFDVPPPTATMIIDGSYGDAEERLDSQRPKIAGLAARGPTLFPVPADGRGTDIAIFLQESGFDVAIDDAVRSVAVMLTQAGRESVREQSVPLLENLIRDARPLDGDAKPQGVMVAHGGSGDAGVAGALIKRWKDQADPQIAFTGHLAAGTTGRKLVDSGRALFQRWNVHPAFSDNLQLVVRVNPQRVIPAFGDPKYLPIWRERVAPRELISFTPIAL